MARFLALMPLGLLGLTSVVATGCDDPDVAPDAAPVPPDMQPAGPPPGFPAVLEIAAAQATITVPFTASASGSASAPFGSVAMTSDAGTLQIDGTSLASFVYMTVPFAGYVLYQGFAVGPQRWDVFWLYCQGTGLAHIYDEGVGGPELFVRPASGTCNGTDAVAAVPVSLPALALPAPRPFGGYTVTGPDVTVTADGTGSLTLDGRTLPLVVFGEVDCSTICGAPGWYELHSIVWDEAQRRVIFLIVYLINGRPNQVQLTYARSLPDLGDPIGTRNLAASWTARGSRSSGNSATSSTEPARLPSGAPPLGVPPPALR
jgi:hypothetical protein